MSDATKISISSNPEDEEQKEVIEESNSKSAPDDAVNETSDEQEKLLQNESDQNTNKSAADTNDKDELPPGVESLPLNDLLEKKICEKIETNFLSSGFGSITTIKSAGRKQTINARTILWYMAFFGFVINYTYRININIAIVDMVKTMKKTSISNGSECFVSPAPLIPAMLNGTFQNSSSRVNFSNLNEVNAVNIDFHNANRFAWDEVEQSLILGSFFWFHWLLQIPGGLLAPKFGTKLVFGFSNFISCFSCFFIPFAAYWDVKYLIAIRIFQGAVSGLCWPAMHHLTAQWIPPNERSKFVTSYMGSSIGIALFYPLFGSILSLSSWEYVFHLTGLLGTVWYAAWLYFVYDSPAQHPRIDPYERLYIEKALSGTLHDASEKRKTPWLEILKSKPVWINIIGQWGGVWGLFTLMTQAPTYFRLIHGWGLQMTGLLSGIPHLMRMIFAYLFSVLADWLLKSNRMSRTNVRKLAGAMTTIVKGLFVLGLAFSGCNSSAAIVCLTLATCVHGAVSSGQLASMIDISPNYSGVTLGLTGVIVVWPGVISPYIVGKLTMGNQTIQQWQYVFLIAGAVLIACGIVYVLFLDSTQQSWNSSTAAKSKNGAEEKEKPEKEQLKEVRVHDCDKIPLTDK